VIPKTSKKHRLSENLIVYDFKLTNEEYNNITNLNKGTRFVDPISLFGFPYFD
jgi:diketogulonate reductase-like aldo/keto reductase